VSIRLTEALETVDWPELATVYERAPLGARDPEQLRRAYEKSYRVCFAYDGARLVGAGRVLSDGEFYAAIYDVVVLPEYQGQGIGTRIMETLLENLSPGPVILFAAPGREGFYERLGFRRMKTAMGLFRHPDRARERGYIE
jgi:ribosomal protein S18 acetylase RimI-like enzyme